MSNFDLWCDADGGDVSGHRLSLLCARDCDFEIAIEAVAKIAPSHYASDERLASILDRLGKKEAAGYLRDKLPISKKARSGELGEILAMSYIEECTIWDRSIRKLRWKDHREMPLRGDDLLAVGYDEDNDLQFLKGESKSRAKLARKPIQDARKALNANKGRPTPHALSYLSDRLAEEGKEQLADDINKAQYKDGIPLKNVSHMIFAFCGNNPKTFLEADLQGYRGKAKQFPVGLRVSEHQAFIRAVFEKVMADGDD